MGATVLAVWAGWTVLAGLATAGALAIDKRAARLGRPRVPERRLHGLELAGGWLGSLVARRALRHKTRKRSYRLRSAAIVTAHLLVWTALLWWATR
jgi:uncharacterized membrane protein YsdA (DUF1294 family)